ncbi:hypothetical protein ACGF8B_37605 [Streptomyces sp. NPDC047917]|uniref:hypothetical protein n=1 Tax=Streptomyces sp. NPDC047917 TaxID=3365491 RepID=UPI00371B80E7
MKGWLTDEISRPPGRSTRRNSASVGAFPTSPEQWCTATSVPKTSYGSGRTASVISEPQPDPAAREMFPDGFQDRGSAEGPRSPVGDGYGPPHAVPFPPGFRGLGIEVQDMVMLDADACGHALGVLKGPLDEQRGEGLIRLTAVFEKVLPAIDDEYATRYYTHVRDMAVLAADVENLREKWPSGLEGSPGS